MFAHFSLLALIGEQSACFPGISVNNAFDSVNVNSVYEIKVKINNLRDKLPGPSLQTSVSMAGNKVYALLEDWL